MLKAAIIYLQGSGGNLLARSLTLDEGTVAYLPREYAHQQPNIEINVSGRFNFYNNWNANNWIQTEQDIAIWYHHGLQDFVNYELSEKWLIDSFHPEMFKTEIDKQILFESEKSWEHLIFIRYNESDLETIKKLAKLKRRDLNHGSQFATEIPIFNNLIKKYTGHYINWHDIVDKTKYIIAIKNLATAMNLKIDYLYVEKLWDTWNHETLKILYE